MDKRWATLLQFVGIGWYIGICIVLGVLGGRWLGRKLDSEVFFTIIGLFVGLSVAFLGVYRMLELIMDKNKNNNNKDRR